MPPNRFTFDAGFPRWPKGRAETEAVDQWGDRGRCNAPLRGWVCTRARRHRGDCVAANSLKVVARWRRRGGSK